MVLLCQNARQPLRQYSQLRDLRIGQSDLRPISSKLLQQTTYFPLDTLKCPDRQTLQLSQTLPHW